ncbi:hypothetical protein Poly30_28080 [Planctomycetes bacterium Poly30]|uniref:Hypervirulence associated protein TUDOR domain-containing protein n=1 Tax=Saltatorellus ferox TaxID=2528018 RepID=A0A518ET69_9BACT|nr:hypothetical protein Poly30_28080 [Planctomycetes bacterium Poly30]
MIREGTKVQWTHAGHPAEGTVAEIFHEDVTRTLDGSEITRKATQDEPAYLIEQSDGARVLKGSSEVQRADA